MITVLICGLLAALAGAVLLELYQSKCSERDLLPLKQEVEEYFGREVKMSELELEYDRMLTDKNKKAVPSKQVDADLGRETTGISRSRASE